MQRKLWVAGVFLGLGYYVVQLGQGDRPVSLSPATHLEKATLKTLSSLETQGMQKEGGVPGGQASEPILSRDSFDGTEGQCKRLGFPHGSSERLNGAGKRVLVTGAAGFIGSHVARWCRDLGMQVVGIDDLSGGFVENIPEGIDFIQVDVKNATALELVFMKYKKFDYVYHLAAYAAEGLSHFVRSYNYRNNLVGGVEVLNFALKYNTSVFVFTSSIAVYGTVSGAVTEKIRPAPEDPYGVAKFAMELDLQVAHETHGMKYIIFRPHNVYGPNQNIADKYRNVIGIFMNNILNGRPMTIFGDGTQTRCFSFIDDVAPLVAKAPLVELAHNEAFNVGSDHFSSLNELASLVGTSMAAKDESSKVVHLDRRHEVDHAEAWHAKLRCFFNPPPPTPLREGLQKTADWVKSRTAGFEAVEFRAVELIRGMPRSWVRESLKQSHTVLHTADDNPRFTAEQRKKVRTADDIGNGK
eukprot:TRINITY_DN20780_c0_g1_i2.p1 TRINITY_DN20780_c0_g1~~TRINITY_DN20780_c0_g1_i2.p1  ORF type:complete len:469 (+),score=175.45 TRINITY_DN20780_c0_g1_i2:112-1518(+)